MQRKGNTILLPFVAVTPNLHVVGRFNQIFAEIGMSNADQLFGTFPCRRAHEVDHAVFRCYPVDLRARVRDNRAGQERRFDARFVFARGRSSAGR